MAPARLKPRAPISLDRVIHEPVRLAIVCALVADGPLTFKDLRARLGATDGNLGVHARRLETAGYLACSKSFDGRMPRTEYRLTAKGLRALDAYRVRLRALLGSLG